MTTEINVAHELAKKLGIDNDVKFWRHNRPPTRLGRLSESSSLTVSPLGLPQPSHPSSTSSELEFAQRWPQEYTQQSQSPTERKSLVPLCFVFFMLCFCFFL